MECFCLGRTGFHHSRAGVRTAWPLPRGGAGMIKKINADPPIWDVWLASHRGSVCRKPASYPSI
jgi:hypothetical protein